MATRKNSKNLRVALFFSGRITAYEHVTALDDLYKKYNCTSFCSLNKTATNPYLDTFFNKYKMGPSQIRFEKTVFPDWLQSIEKHPWAYPTNVYSTLYHNKKAFELIEPYMKANNVNFDIVMLFRADIDSKKPIIFVKPVPKTVYIPEEKNGGHPKGFLESVKMTAEDYGVNSTLAYGSYKSMMVYATIVDRMQEMYNNHKIVIHHERLIKKGLELYGIHIKLVKYDYTLHPRRHNSHYNLS